MSLAFKISIGFLILTSQKHLSIINNIDLSENSLHSIINTSIHQIYLDQWNNVRLTGLGVCVLNYVINISLNLCSDSKHITLAHAATFQYTCMALISTVWAQLLEQIPAAKTHTQFSFSQSGSPLFFFYNTNTHTHNAMPLLHCWLLYYA